VDERLAPPIEDVDHVRSDPGAELELVMFGDFQCPYCLGAQPKLSRATLLSVAGDLGLDAERVAAELETGAHRPRIERDLDSAARSGATGTPTFFVNGARHFGVYDAGTLVEALAGGV
jgi:protein-disulfide isomerase